MYKTTFAVIVNLFIFAPGIHAQIITCTHVNPLVVDSITVDYYSSQGNKGLMGYASEVDFAVGIKSLHSNDIFVFPGSFQNDLTKKLNYKEKEAEIIEARKLSGEIILKKYFLKKYVIFNKY